MLVLDLEAARRSILHLAFWDRMIAFCCYTVSVILFSCFFSCLSQCAALQSVTMVLAYFGSQLPCFGLFKKQLGFSIRYFLLACYGGVRSHTNVFLKHKRVTVYFSMNVLKLRLAAHA